MYLKDLNFKLKNLDCKSTEETSKEINKIYLDLLQLPDNLKKNKLLDILKRYTLKKLNKIFLEGSELKGSYETNLIKNDSSLKVKRSKWARKRGYSFEKRIYLSFKEYFKKVPIGFIMKNFVNRFLYQPYDLILYLKGKVPIFIECKASGLKLLKDGTFILAADSRRYECYLKNLESIRSTILACDLPFLFFFGSESSFFVISGHFINRYVSTLRTKRVLLTQKDFLEIPFDFTLWPSDLIDQLNQLNQNALRTQETNDKD